MAPDFQIVQRSDTVDYQAATGTLSPELRSALLRAASRAGLKEDDPLYGVLVANAELLSALTATRAAGVKKMSETLFAQEALLKQVSSVLASNLAGLAEQIARVNQTIADVEGSIQRSLEIERLEQQKAADQLRQEIRSANSAACDTVEGIQALLDVLNNRIIWVIAITYVVGVFTYPVFDAVLALVRQLLGT